MSRGSRSATTGGARVGRRRAATREARVEARRAASFAVPALIVLALIGAWQAGCALFDADPLVFPPPSDVATALWEDRSLLASDLGVTVQIVLLGLAASIACGVAAAVAMHLSPALRRALTPLVVGSQAVPIPVIAPILVLLLGFGMAPKILMVAVICFFPVAINGLDGLRAVPDEQRRLFRTLDASRLQTLLRLEAPAALPQLFTGLRVAAAVAVIGAVFAEWAGAEAGLGRLLLIAGGQLETARAYAAVVLLCALAIALYTLFGLLERRLVTWSP